MSTLQLNLPNDLVIIVSGFDNDPAREGKPAVGIDVFDYKSGR
jgi:hypothetical protein